MAATTSSYRSGLAGRLRNPAGLFRKIAGHGSLNMTRRHLHPEQAAVFPAGDSLTARLASPAVPEWFPAFGRREAGEDRVPNVGTPR